MFLSESLYFNYSMLSYEIIKTLKESIKAKETIRDIAMKIYEWYEFRDEIMKAKKVLPKYLIKALKERDTEIMKQIEKLKTKPLRIAYKELIRKMDTFTDEELQRLLNTAYHEKMRYYANRIADTETHRAFMSKKAFKYLEDEKVKFVRFEMSSAHKIKDICDFYANLDVGYGKGVIPKKEMRSLPLHPHCHCVYVPIYKKVKGKRKDWKSAVNETMDKFSDYEKKEILGSYHKLKEFERGVDIEEIFNRIRPNYPIRKYVDIFKNADIVGMDILTQAPPKEKRLKPILVDVSNLKGVDRVVAEIGNEIVEFGYKNGLEKCYFIDTNGRKVGYVVSDENLECNITNLLKRLDKNKKYIQIHNHFDDVTISLNDVYTFVKHKNIEKMIVVSEKFIYEIKKTNKTKKLNIIEMSLLELQKNLLKFLLKNMVLF